MEQSLNPVSECLNREGAKALIGLRANADVQARVDDLATKCNEGELTPDERAEYEMFVWVGQYIATLQARARHLLA